ncbi:uncharacterized protein LOC21398096 [Morus notabilis]|uniref:uncharacterized protein LOC21398096 n=1 Tax=Morus notabilis TaxID=981085 RepID=UPI000CED7ED6|nr:uncharacterized protein LOC21398096 [Morus notabilis]XP_024031762.1 uncharacterized protein LOC21398096 [Morus notabilis]
MATESNTGFHFEETLSSALNRHAISFQSGAINSTSEMLPFGNYFGVNSSMFSGHSNNSAIIGNNPVIGGGGGGGGSLLLDSVPGLKHDVGLAVEWSVEEQHKLERGLVEYGNEPSIMRYIKIAALLREKTVRDVALRCRWMMRKRRKPEEIILGKKVHNRKDKLMESSSKINVTSFPPLDVAGYPFIMNHMDQNKCMPFEGVSGTAKHLLEQNAQTYNQITANLSTYKLQENIDLFCQTRNNISAILNDMRNMPGIMSRMPELPVSIDEVLANNILPNTA